MREEIVRAGKEKKLIIGYKAIRRALAKAQVAKIFLAINCPTVMENELKYLASLSQIEIKKLELNNNELSVLCKRRHAIAAIALKK